MKEGLAVTRQRLGPAKRGTAPEAVKQTGQGIINAHLKETIEPERRRAMIADAAYFYGEHRGFEPGHEIEDWLAAESQIDDTLRLADMEAAALLREQSA